MSEVNFGITETIYNYILITYVRFIFLSIICTQYSYDDILSKIFEH